MTTSGTTPFRREKRSSATGSATTTNAWTRKIKAGVIALPKCFVGEVNRDQPGGSERSVTQQDLFQRDQQDFEVEPDVAPADILEVVGDRLAPVEQTAAIDLRQPGDPRLAGEFVHLIRGIVLENFRCLGTRPDQSHVAEHRPQVR